MITQINESNGVCKVYTRCDLCGRLSIVNNVPAPGFDRWRNGQLIQNALPTLNADERELLMTGMSEECCFPK